MSAFIGSDKAIKFLFDMVSNIASDYDETSTYSVNDYAVYEGILYKCTSAITIAETFTPAHWTAVLIMDEIAAGGGGGGSSTLAGLSDVLLSSVSNGDVLTYDGALNKWKNGTGGGSSGHSYSSAEHIVGTWIDGENVYERTVDFGSNVLINSNTWYTTTIPTTGITAIINAFGMNNDGTFFGFVGMSRDGAYCNLLQTRNAAITIRWLTFQYLKTAL